MILLKSFIIFVYMNIRERVQKRLKPKVKQFGFTKKVFKSVAAKVADNLEDIDENASEDDINAKIDDAIAAVMPYLALVQSQAAEQLEEWKKSQLKSDNEEDGEETEDDDSDDTQQNRSNKSRHSKTVNNGNSGNSKELKVLLDAVNALKDEVSSLKSGKITDARKSKLEALLKDSGAFGRRTLKDFSSKAFADENEFEDYISDVQDDLKAYNQELSNRGLSGAGDPPGGKGGKSESTEKGFSNSEIEKIMENF